VSSLPRRHTLLLLAVSVGLALGLSGCSNSAKVTPLSSSTLPPTEQAFVTPPPGSFAVLGILQKEYANGVEQDITLSNSSKTPGQNLLRVQVIGAKTNAPKNIGSLSDAIPDDEKISREISELLPGMRVQRAPYLLQNTFGPFSYAAGRSAAGDICLYAWQRLGQPISQKTIFAPRGALQIRLRLCDPHKSEFELLQTMYGLSINVAVIDPMWDPYLKPGSPPAAWGKSGQSIAPQSLEGFTGVVPARQVPVRARPKNVPKPVPETGRSRTTVPRPVVPGVPQPAVEPGSDEKPAINVVVPPPPGAVPPAGQAAVSDDELNPNKDGNPIPN